MTQRRASREVRALARRAADLAAEASLDGLDAATAVMAAAIHVSFDAQMTRRDLADWFRRLAAEFEATEGEAYGAKVRASLRDSARPAAAPAGNPRRSNAT